MVWRFSRWLPWLPSWRLEQNNFSNSNLYVAPMPPTKFQSHSRFWRWSWKCEKLTTDGQRTKGHHTNWPGAQLQVKYWNFQDGHLNKMLLAILNLHVAPLPPTKFQTSHLWVDQVWRFSRWPLWRPSWILKQILLAILNLYCALMPPICSIKLSAVAAILDIRTEILAVLNLHVSPMPPTKFQLNPTYHSEADVVSIFSRLPPWRPSWILERNNCSNSKSPRRPNASHQVWAQSDRVHEQMQFKDFQAGCRGGHLGYWNRTILQFWFSKLLRCLPSS